MQKKCLTVFVGLLLTFFFEANAQNIVNRGGKLTQIEGVVMEQGRKNSSVAFATVSLMPSEISTVTNLNGSFIFKNVEPGKVGIKIKYLGMEPIDTTIIVKSGIVNPAYIQHESFKFLFERSNGSGDSK